MNVQEFSNQFDVYFNSIASNQAPSLDEYEKSVFLTKSQNEILLSYFDLRKNKVQEGFDGSHRRQIDFSNITRVYNTFREIKVVLDYPEGGPNITVPPQDTAEHFKSVREVQDMLDSFQGIHYNGNTSTYTVTSRATALRFESKLEGSNLSYRKESDNMYIIKGEFSPALFDLRKNSISVDVPDMLLFINEKTVVNRNGKEVELVTVPIQFTEYDRLMNKPFKRPAKNQAWRLINNSTKNKSDIVVGPSDEVVKYSIRYLKRPKPIILADLDGLDIEGYTEATECELDPILHPEILQRAVEQAKAYYSGNLQDIVSLGQISQTEIGVLTQSK